MNDLGKKMITKIPQYIYIYIYGKVNRNFFRYAQSGKFMT